MSNKESNLNNVYEAKINILTLICLLYLLPKIALIGDRLNKSALKDVTTILKGLHLEVEVLEIRGVSSVVNLNLKKKIYL